MIDKYARRKLSRSAWLAAALTLLLAGCAESGAGYGSSSAAGYASPDPYHYRINQRAQAVQVG